MESIKVVLVGDGAVGKTSLLIKRTTGAFPSDYVPTVFDVHSESQVVDDEALNVTYWDTAGQGDYDRLRPLSYPQTNAFVVCFDDDERSTVKSKWLPELAHHAPGVPVVLAAMKSDRPRASAIDETLAKAWGAKGYFEVSALEDVGVDELFRHVSRVGLWHRRVKTTHNRSDTCLPQVLPWRRRRRRNRNNKRKNADTEPAFASFCDDVPLNAKVDCGICLGTVDRRDARRMSCCHARFCGTCLKDYLAALLRDGKIALACPADKCRRTLHPNAILALGGSDCYDTFKANLQTNHAHRLTSIRHHTAHAAKKGFANTKVCPHCSVIVYRNGGCNNMSCNCGHCFGWAEADPVFDLSDDTCL